MFELIVASILDEGGAIKISDLQGKIIDSDLICHADPLFESLTTIFFAQQFSIIRGSKNSFRHVYYPFLNSENILNKLLNTDLLHV